MLITSWPLQSSRHGRTIADLEMRGSTTKRAAKVPDASGRGGYISTWSLSWTLISERGWISRPSSGRTIQRKPGVAGRVGLLAEDCPGIRFRTDGAFAGEVVRRGPGAIRRGIHQERARACGRRQGRKARVVYRLGNRTEEAAVSGGRLTTAGSGVTSSRRMQSATERGTRRTL